MAMACKGSAALALPTALSGKRLEPSSLGGASLRLPARVGRRRASELTRCDASHAAEEQAQVKSVDTKEFRHKLTRGENYNRSGWGYKKEMLKQMDVEYTSTSIGVQFRVSDPQDCEFILWRINVKR